VSGTLSCTRLIQSGEAMCEQCKNQQKQIDQFKRLLQHRFDPLTEERLKARPCRDGNAQSGNAMRPF